MRDSHPAGILAAAATAVTGLMLAAPAAAAPVDADNLAALQPAPASIDGGTRRTSNLWRQVF